MTKSTYPTKYRLEHLKKRINSEIDPLINQAELSVKSIVADLTESAELKLAKKIKADVVIKELEKAIQELEIKQRKAQTFFGKISNKELKQKLSYKFDKKDRDSYYRSSSYDRGITPEDCREQLREWAQFLATKEAEKIRGEGDATATATYADAYNRDPEFYDFTRSLKAYRNTFNDEGDILLIDPDSDYFKYLNKSEPK